MPKHSQAYATFIEAGMVATHSAPSHCTNNRINQLPGSRCKLLELLQIRKLPRTVAASSQSTISRSQGHSNSRCNLATQFQCFRARGHIDSLHVTNGSSCNLGNASLFQTTTGFLQLLATILKIQNQTNNNLPANAKGISTAEVNTHCIEGQTNKPHVACNSHC